MTCKVEWKCSNPILCTYKYEEYTAQRTYCDTVSVYYKGEKIGGGNTLDDAARFVEQHTSRAIS